MYAPDMRVIVKITSKERRRGHQCGNHESAVNRQSAMDNEPASTHQQHSAGTVQCGIERGKYGELFGNLHDYHSTVSHRQASRKVHAAIWLIADCRLLTALFMRLVSSFSDWL